MSNEQYGVQVVQSGGNFANPAIIEQREKTEANTRRFTGNGTEFLEVPGLKKIERVIAAGVEIPLSQVMEVPMDVNLKTLPVREPMVALSQTADGRTILLRSQYSNFGIWQKGRDVLVTGEWDDQSAEATAPAPALTPSTPSAPSTGSTPPSTDAEDFDFGSLSATAVKAIQKAFPNGPESVAAATDEELLAVKGINADNLAEVRRVFGPA